MGDGSSRELVTVMGLGRFGGGVGVARFLAERGARVLITDLLPAEKLTDSLRAVRESVGAGSVDFRLDGHDEADFTDCDLVVANPAVPRPWTNRFLGAARSANVPITTEIRMLVERIDRDRVIGVTGTAGKSTTAAMIHHVLKRLSAVRRPLSAVSGDLKAQDSRLKTPSAFLGGNIGGSLLGRLDEIGPDDWIVLELSSAMLHWLGEDAGGAGQPGWSPHVAVTTNLSPNHLDWHGTLAHYRKSKGIITRFARSGDPAIGPDDPGADADITLAVPGRHNRDNARLAVAAVNAATGLGPREAAELLADFAGLPHRLQLVADHDALRFFNDSKSTTPRATRLAIEAIGEPHSIHLVAGGYDKAIDLGEITALAPSLAGLYAIGATGKSLAESAPPSSHAEYCGTLDRAAERARARMRPGDALLLSPGCASWDQFENYVERGEAFCRIVEKWVSGGWDDG